MFEGILKASLSAASFQVQLYRSRMVEAGAGARLAAVSLDPTYDGQTRAAAGAIWMAVGEMSEGQDPRWWGCMLGQQAEVRGRGKVNPKSQEGRQTQPLLVLCL